MARSHIVSFALLLTCAAIVPRTAAAQSTAPCSVESIDPVHLERGPVFRDCDVQQRASKGREPRLDFEFPQGLTCAVAEIEFVIDTAGIPDTSAAVVVVDANSPEFVTFLRGKLGAYRFKAAVREGQPVRQVYRLRVVKQQEKLPFTVTSVQGRNGGTMVNGGTMPPQNRRGPTTPRCR